MPTNKITEKANEIPNYANLPIVAQISLVYEEIEAARRFRIPLALICKALNDAGSTVSLRYLRDVLFVIRKRAKRDGFKSAVEQFVSGAPIRQEVEIIEKIKPSEARNRKAEMYTNLDNPLLTQFNKDKE